MSAPVRRGAALALTAALLAGVCAAASAADAGLAELMQRLAARRHGHAAFVERQFLAVLDRPLESSGELYYDAPDHLEKRTLAPHAESLVLERGALSVTRGRRRYALALRDYPQIAPFIDSIRATLAGDLPALERDYAADFSAGTTGWTLTLVPREPGLARLLARIRIVGAGTELREVTIERVGGDRSVLAIRELPDG